MMTVGVQKSEIRQHNTLTCVKGKSRGIKSKLWLVSKLKCINQPQRYDKGTHTHTVTDRHAYRSSSGSENMIEDAN